MMKPLASALTNNGSFGLSPEGPFSFDAFVVGTNLWRLQSVISFSV